MLARRRDPYPAIAAEPLFGREDRDDLVVDVHREAAEERTDDGRERRELFDEELERDSSFVLGGEDRVGIFAGHRRRA
jgi:hypothetical protein